MVIIEEMARGNFSFPILVVGIIQLILMVRNNRGNGNESKDSNINSNNSN